MADAMSSMVRKLNPRTAQALLGALLATMLRGNAPRSAKGRRIVKARKAPARSSRGPRRKASRKPAASPSSAE